MIISLSLIMLNHKALTRSMSLFLRISCSNPHPIFIQFVSSNLGTNMRSQSKRISSHCSHGRTNSVIKRNKICHQQTFKK
ncbi:hypothetical protein VIGAN_01352300 [Vigna angularis var. angularis]|uniref:Uncharacterized protein n=1 Tax=Vigna angularis var. angularis TaxID=157739 RepID=A0A0S3R533_PHAAN|nr:hypothetical protein VIGAN_01352300 [Vigna angularis var. angularis]